MRKEGRKEGENEGKKVGRKVRKRENSWKERKRNFLSESLLLLIPLPSFPFDLKRSFNGRILATTLWILSFAGFSMVSMTTTSEEEALATEDETNCSSSHDPLQFFSF